IPQEYPGLHCRCIDLGGSHPLTGRNGLDLLLAELNSRSTDPIVAYRGRRRWVQTFETLQLYVEPEPIRDLRPQGVYLIVGGLSGPGLALARFLAEAVQA